jgi:hypothetical protein
MGNFNMLIECKNKWSGQVRSDQVRSDQVRSGQVRSGQLFATDNLIWNKKHGCPVSWRLDLLWKQNPGGCSSMWEVVNRGGTDYNDSSTGMLHHGLAAIYAYW